MNHNLHSTIYVIARGLLVVASVLVLLFGLASNGRAELAGDMPQHAVSDVLEQRAFEFWQTINAARENPMATAARLDIPEEVVRQTFTTQEWILEQGLPPLAWNESLAGSASTHGRDMFEREYYSYVTPENATYWDRIESAGYIPAEAGETMNALFFENIIPLDEAFKLLVDAMLRDELMGNPSVERNIFSPDFTEVGISFAAGDALIVDGQPYVYLMLADFARKEQAESHPRIIGSYPEGYGVVMHPLEGGWFRVDQVQDVDNMPSGVFQIPFPRGGADLILIDNYGVGYISEVATLHDVDRNAGAAGDSIRSLNHNRRYHFALENELK